MLNLDCLKTNKIHFELYMEVKFKNDFHYSPQSQAGDKGKTKSVLFMQLFNLSIK